MPWEVSKSTQHSSEAQLRWNVSTESWALLPVSQLLSVKDVGIKSDGKLGPQYIIKN